MRVKSSGRCVILALAIVFSCACAKAPTAEPEGRQSGRTINGHTYSDAPVDVKLGPNTFRIPANYLDSQISPWPGDGVSLVIEWPEMGPSAPGARAHPRTNDFRKEIRVLVNYVDRLPIETSLDRHASNEAITPPDSLERDDPRDRLDLRVAQPEDMGLTPYTVDETKMARFAKAYEAKYGTPPPRGRLSEEDWYVARAPDGRLSSFIKCGSKAHLKDGVRLDGDEIIDVPSELPVAGCVHYITDIDDRLSISINYKRVFLKDWKRMEDAIRGVLARSKVS